MSSSKRAPSPRKTTANRARSRATQQTLSHEDIARRARMLYEQSGFQGGRDVEFWLEAERQLSHERKL